MQLAVHPLELDKESAAADSLPPQVLRLAPREREVAMIIYVHGACSAKDVQALLSTPLSSGAVRSMLVRLIKKGLLTRAWGKRGRGQGHVYLPAVTPAGLKEKALQDLADKYFGGSLLSAAMSALKLLGQEAGEARAGATAITVPFELPARANLRQSSDSHLSRRPAEIRT